MNIVHPFDECSTHSSTLGISIFNILIYKFLLMWTCCMLHHPIHAFILNMPSHQGCLNWCAIHPSQAWDEWEMFKYLLRQNKTFVDLVSKLPTFHTYSFMSSKETCNLLSMSVWHCTPTLTSSMWLLPHIQWLVMCLVVVTNFVLANPIAHSKCICGPCLLQHSLSLFHCRLGKVDLS